MRLAIAALALMLLPDVGAACGVDSDCAVGDRHYRIALPPDHVAGTPIGAVIWSHGYRGSAAGVMRNGSLRRSVHARGLALIAAQGVDGTWDLPNGPRTPDSTGAAEFAYFADVIADVSARFAIDDTRLIAAGFSAGGMMVWNLACKRPEMFAGFVPISGTYWSAPPESCVTPVASVVHIHGNADSTVPLDGRPIGPTRQGRVADALAHYTAQGRFGAVTVRQAGPLRCEERGNPAGERLEFCLFQGGHSFRTEYLDHAIVRLMVTGQL